jgi:hypothetical protein
MSHYNAIADQLLAKLSNTRISDDNGHNKSPAESTTSNISYDRIPNTLWSEIISYISFDVSPYVSMSPLLDHGILMVNHTLRQRFRDAAITIRIMDPNPPPRSDAAMVTTTPFQYDRLTKLIRIFKWLRGVRSFHIAVSADNDGAVQIVENIFHWSSLRSLHLGKMPG